MSLNRKSRKKDLLTTFQTLYQDPASVFHLDLPSLAFRQGETKKRRATVPSLEARKSGNDGLFLTNLIGQNQGTNPFVDLSLLMGVGLL